LFLADSVSAAFHGEATSLATLVSSGAALQKRHTW
jgi:hypothetical protein